MGLVTEAEKLEAFNAVYPDELDRITADGFRILTFDPETGYAQFKNAGLTSYAEYIEFAQTADINPVQRGRYYEKPLSLHLAWIKYPLGRYQIEWTFFCEGSKETAPFEIPTMCVYLPDAESDVPLVECRYRNNELLPESIKITAGTLDKALDVYKTTRDQERTKTPSVPLAFTIRPRKSVDDYAIFGVKDPVFIYNFSLGYAEPNQPFTHPEFPGTLTIKPLEDGSLKIVREEDQTETSLIVPCLDYQDVYQRLRGSWRAYAAFPQRYPVEFLISFAK